MPASRSVRSRVLRGAALLAVSLSLHACEKGDAPNQAPSASVTCGATGEDAPSTCGVAATDPDSGQTLTCTIDPSTTCTGAAIVECSSVSLAAQGEGAGPGSCVVAVAISDGAGGSIVASATVAILEGNTSPSIDVSCSPASEDAGGSCAVEASDPDVPAQSPTCSLGVATTCAGAVLTGCTSVSVPAQGETAGPGSCVVAVAVSDGAGGSTVGSGTLAVTEVNRSPVATVTCGSAAEDEATSCAVEASDPDVPAQSPTCSLGVATTCAGAALEGCSSVSVPAQGEDAGPGSCVVAVDANDGDGGSTFALGTVTIDEANLPPEFTTPPVTVLAYLGVPTEVTAGGAIDADRPAQTITCSKGTSDCAFPVTVTGSGAGVASCSVSFTATAKERCSVGVLASDAFDSAAVTTVTIDAVRDCTWTGSASTSWSTASNWSCGAVPGAGDRANVPAGAPRYPAVGGGVQVGVLELDGTLLVPAGASLEATRSASLRGTVTNAGTLTLPALDAATLASGTLVNTGTLVVQSGDVVVGNGVTLVQDGNLHAAGMGTDTIASLTVEAGGVLTHSRGVIGGLALTVVATLEVKAGGKIDVSSKGYRGGYQDGISFFYAQAEGGTGASYSAGGSHAGSGGSGTYSGVTNQRYGDPLAPSHLGSGGGSTPSWIVASASPGGNGGGKVMLVCGSAIVDGEVLADGGAGGVASGGGSGGSVVLTLMGGAFSGAGTLRAAGGSGTATGGAGGAGRIAVVGYGAKTFSGVTSAGTILTGADEALGDLTLASVSHTIAAETTLSLDSIAVPTGAQLVNAGTLTLAGLTVSGGVVANAGTLMVTGLTVSGGVVTNAGTLTLSGLTVSGGSVMGNAGTLHVPALDAATMTSGALTNTGTLVVASPDVVVGSGVTFTQDGDLHASGMAADTLGSLTVASGGVVTHSVGLLGGLSLTLTGALDVQAGGRIDVSARGYRGALRDGNGSSEGETRGAGGTPTTSGGASGTAGGSYGGSGARSTYGGTTNATYGDPFAPDDLGSGGGSYYPGFGYAGANGGGKVKIVCQSATVNGQILADGGGAGAWAGAGSGGAIALALTGGTLSGTGTIRAAGGSPSGATGGAGGAGRIKVAGYTAPDLFSGTVSAASVLMAAEDAAGSLALSGPHAFAAASTVTLDEVDVLAGGSLASAGTLTVDWLGSSGGALTNTGTLTLGSLRSSGGALTNAGTLTAQHFEASGSVLNTGTMTLPALDESTLTSGTFSNAGTLELGSPDVVVGNGVTLVEDGDLHALGMAADTLGSLTVAAGGRVTHSRGVLGGVALTLLGTLEVQAGGAIDVSAKGYRGAFRDGLNSYWGETRGTAGAPTTSGGAGTASGGSYGGSGGNGTGGGVTNATYGDPLAPDDLGSGGGSNSNGWPAGNGGGKVKIACESAVVNGDLLADGGGGDRSGGGSGGAIALTLSGGTLSGAGTIRAAGGGASGAGGTGGGGRALVSGTGTATFSGTIGAPGNVAGSALVTVGP